MQRMLQIHPRSMTCFWGGCYRTLLQNLSEFHSDRFRLIGAMCAIAAGVLARPRGR